MGRIAILKIGYGNFQQGFEVSLEIKEDKGQSLVEIEGNLPINTDIESLYQSWQQSFYQLAGRYRHSKSWDVDNSIATNVSNLDLVTDCQQKVEDLEANMKSWLQPSANNNWQRIREKLAQELASHSPAIRLIIKARETILWKLPWHLWDLLVDYPDVGIGYSTNEYSAPILKQVTRDRAKPASKADRVRILAIFGNSENLDLTADKEAIDKLENTEVDFLLQPTATELIQKLQDDPGWDIFFFAGHSHSNNDTGRIYINDQEENLTIEQFKNALTEAISKGLKIAIFNSCDGLALAEGLAELHIPIVIVMQEIVPDVVAQSFLKEFLREYNVGNLLYTAARKAQSRLEAFTHFPGATLLPLILQNPATVPPRWNNFLHTSSEKLPTQSREVISFQPVKPGCNLVLKVIINSLVVSAIVLGIRWLGLLQPLELYAFDRLLELQPKQEKPDPRILVVTVDEDDIKYQDSQNMQRVGSLSDRSLALALDELETLNPTTIALDIYRPNGFTSEVVDRIQNDNRFFAICKIQEFKSDRYSGGVEPPSNLPQERLVFSDIPIDQYKIVRRQFLDMTGDMSDPCQSQFSLSFLVAQHYLYQQHKMKATHTGKKEWQLGHVIFKRLTNRSAGYQKLDDRGYQILLNYRMSDSLEQVTHSISLKELLDQGVFPGFKARMQKPIILIGTIKKELYKDYHLTPYGQEIPGVFLQAQMTSQILSAVLDERPLLRYWNPWIEAIWIWSWSIIGGLLAISISQQWRLLLNILGSLIGIIGICFILLTYSIWIPLVPTVLVLSITTLIFRKKLINKNK